MTKQILQDPQFRKLLEESKKAIEDSNARTNIIKEDMAKVKRRSKEIDMKIRLLL